jgi:hypothetical protein
LCISGGGGCHRPQSTHINLGGVSHGLSRRWASRSHETRENSVRNS